MTAPPTSPSTKSSIVAVLTSSGHLLLGALVMVVVDQRGGPLLSGAVPRSYWRRRSVGWAGLGVRSRVRCLIGSFLGSAG